MYKIQEPYGINKTPEEVIQSIDVPLSTEGVEQAADWMNEQYKAQEERWKESLRRTWV